MISLILTVRNESASLPALLESLLAQTRPPDEIIIVDGGSQDDSVTLLQATANACRCACSASPAATSAAAATSPSALPVVTSSP